MNYHHQGEAPMVRSNYLGVNMIVNYTGFISS